MAKQGQDGKIRFGVVGLGWISQAAILPAFANTENAELSALVSSDPEKLAKLGDYYKVERRYSYDEYEQCLAEVDAVFIGLPNSMHREYTLRAAAAGVHVLCEKPLASSVEDCRAMVEAAEKHSIKLMTAYRLHFEEANLRAVDAIRSGQIGDVRLFNSVFTGQVDQGNVRLSDELTGGTIWDMGVYCVNAARYLLGDEPIEVMGTHAHSHDPRFVDVPPMTSAIMRFADGKIATFTCGWGVADQSTAEVLGSKGRVRLDPAYSFDGALSVEIKAEGVFHKHQYPVRDHFGPEIIHFANCILEGREPGPDGYDGLADAQIIAGIVESARTGRPVRLENLRGGRRPTLDQLIVRPVVGYPPFVNAAPPYTGG
jgi:glucose-fructose oxidoreductase